MNQLDLKSPKKLEEYLAEVDYREINNYKSSTFAKQFFLFANSQFSFEQTTPSFHYKVIDSFTGSEEFVVNLMFRGAAKSTVCSILMLLYLAVFRELPHLSNINSCLFIGDSKDNGCKNLRENLEHYYNSSETYRSLVPKAKFTEDEIKLWRSDGSLFTVVLAGANSGIRGKNMQGQRPKLAILDDIIKDKDAKSTTTLGSLSNIVESAVIPALDPKNRKVIFNGTPFNAKDPLITYVNSGEWKVNAFPVCKEFPCERHEFNGAWPERFTFDSLYKVYKMYEASGSLRSFYQEYMLRIASDDERLVDIHSIPKCSREYILNNVDEYNFFITTDFATTDKATGDYSVILVWAVDKNDNRYIIDGMCRKQKIMESFDMLFEYVQKYNPMLVGVETSAQQKAFIDTLQRMSLDRDIPLMLARSKANRTEIGIRPTSNKLIRFQQVLPFFENYKIHIAEELQGTDLHTEMMTELDYATVSGFKSKHDDVIDSISQIEQFWVILPDVNENVVTRETRTKRWDDIYHTVNYFEDEEEEVESDYEYYLV